MMRFLVRLLHDSVVSTGIVETWRNQTLLFSGGRADRQYMREGILSLMFKTCLSSLSFHSLPTFPAFYNHVHRPVGFSPSVSKCPLDLEVILQKALLSFLRKRTFSATLSSLRSQRAMGVP